MTRFLSIVFVIAFISCGRKPDISGHWVSVPDDRHDGYYTTIDIIDSLLIQGRGSLTQTYGPDTFIVRGLDLTLVPAFEGKEKFDNLFEVDFPGPPYPPVIRDAISTDSSLWQRPYASVTLRNDTLIADGDHMFSGGYFTRGKPHFESDLFADLNVDIQLLEFHGQNCVPVSTIKWPTWISVGKSRIQLDTFKDTFRIQVGDVYIGSAGISRFLEIEKLKFDLTKEENLSVVFSTDRNSPKQLIEEVIKSIRNHDRSIEIMFPVINLQEEKVCLLDSAGFFALLL